MPAEPTYTRAQGLERFHFWGRYSVDLILQFQTADEAVRSLDVLNRVKHTHQRHDACGGVRAPGAWQVGAKNKNVLVAWIDTDDIPAVHEQLASFGADLKKVGSMAHSIDCGEPFELDIPLPPTEDPRQLTLL